MEVQSIELMTAKDELLGHDAPTRRVLVVGFHWFLASVETTGNVQFEPNSSIFSVFRLSQQAAQVHY